MRQPLGSSPAHKRLPYTGTQRTVDEMLKAADGTRGAQSLRVRYHVERIVRHVAPRDVLSQLAAIYYYYMTHHNYLRDPVPAELVKDPERIVEEIEATGTFLGDCDDATMYIVGGARSIGIKAIPVRVGFMKVPATLTHVLAVARDQYGRAIVVDPVAGVRTYKMLRHAKRFA